MPCRDSGLPHDARNIVTRMYIRRQEASLHFLGRKQLRRPAPNTQMLSVLWKSLMSWVTLWKLGATPQLNTGLLQEESANSRCQEIRQISYEASSG